MKKYCEVSFSVKSILNKTCCELNLYDIVIQAVTHTLINYYIRYRMCGYPLKNNHLDCLQDVIHKFMTKINVRQDSISSVTKW